MRKLLKSKRGDISAPVITILLVIASISIAALVISWLFGVGISTSKQGALVIIGTPTLQVAGNSATLYITLKNAGNDVVTISGAYLSIPSQTATTIVSSSPVTTTISPQSTVALTFTFTLSNVSIPANITSVNGVIQTSAGTIPFTAVIQR